MKLRVARFILALAVTLWWNAGAVATAGFTGDFDAANKLYEQGKFAEASTAYQALLQSGSASAALYFNLGNARFKSGEIGRALAAWRQAEAMAPRDPDVQANLQFIRGQVQGPTVAPDRWQHWLGRLTVNEWTLLAAGAFWVWLLSLTWIQFRPALKPRLRGLAWLGGIATAALVFCLGAALSAASAPSVIVTAGDVAVRNGPLEESHLAFTAHDGAELEVLDRKDDWLRVSARNRYTGWLKRDQVIVLPRDETAKPPG